MFLNSTQWILHRFQTFIKLILSSFHLKQTYISNTIVQALDKNRS